MQMIVFLTFLCCFNSMYPILIVVYVGWGYLFPSLPAKKWKDNCILVYYFPLSPSNAYKWSLLHFWMVSRQDSKDNSSYCIMVMEILPLLAYLGTILGNWTQHWPYSGPNHLEHSYWGIQTMVVLGGLLLDWL